MKRNLRRILLAICLSVFTVLSSLGLVSCQLQPLTIKFKPVPYQYMVTNVIDVYDLVEKEKDVDFQAGIEIEKYTVFSSSLYDSTVDGSTYELTMRTKVGDKKVIFTIEIVNNENGYGIYNLDLDT